MPRLFAKRPEKASPHFWHLVFRLRNTPTGAPKPRLVYRSFIVSEAIQQKIRYYILFFFLFTFVYFRILTALSLCNSSTTRHSYSLRFFYNFSFIRKFIYKIFDLVNLDSKQSWLEVNRLEWWSWSATRDRKWWSINVQCESKQRSFFILLESSKTIHRRFGKVNDLFWFKIFTF